MKKILVAIFAIAFALPLAFAASPTWVGVQVNTNTGTVKPSVLEERFFGFATNTIGLIDGDTVTNYDFPKGIALRSAGLFNGVPYPWYVTSFCGISHIRTSPGDSTIVSSTDNVCLSTPGAYLTVDSNGSLSRTHSNVKIEAPSFIGNGDGLTVNSTNLGEWVQSTTTNVASVERRLDALEDLHEWPETCVLWWTTNMVNGGSYAIPTNFSTRKLEIRVNRAGLTSCVVHLDTQWDPGRSVEIIVDSFCTSGSGTNTMQFWHNGAYLSGGNIETIGGNSAREWILSFDPAARQWRCKYHGVGYYWMGEAASIAGVKSSPPNGPSTVEEWEELWLARHSTLPE